MDPLSVTASVIAILQLTNEAIQYLNDVKQAPKECQQCVVEASNLLSPLISLRYRAEQAQINDPWFEELRKLNVKDGPLDQYKQALELLRTRVEIGDGIQKFKRRLLWKFNKEQVAGILARIERLKSLVSVALEMDHRQVLRNGKLSDAIKDDTACIRASLLPLRASAVAIEAGIYTLQTETLSVKDNTAAIRDALPPLQVSTAAVRDAQSLQHHQEVVKWLSPTDFPAQQHDIISRRQEGTAQWFLDSAEFREWLQGTDKTLFCPGIPGAGKTMMAAVAIDYLCRTTHSDNVGIAYLFCSYKARVDQSAPNLLAALLKQLVHSRPDIAAPVTGIHDQHSERQTKPSLDELTQALLSICSAYTAVYVVVDALDECSNVGRRQLIGKLRSLQASRNMRLMYTSRDVPEVTEYFRSSPSLEIRASEEDVRRFVIDQLPQLYLPVDEELEREIARMIVEAVDGMFLLARLHVNTLLEQTTPNEVRATLTTLRKGPEALKQAYEDVLHRINGQPKKHCELAQKALCWITFAQRPLTKNELCHALAIKPDMRALDHGDLTDATFIVTICAGLVTVDVETGIIRLVHYTTQEYFERVRLDWKPIAQEEIALACLTYLSFEAFKSGSCPSDKSFEQRHTENQFFHYSARHWSEHVRPVQDSTPIAELALAFLRSDTLMDSAIQAEDVSRYSHKGFPSGPTGLHLTARYGLLYLSQRLLVSGLEDGNTGVDPKDGHDREPLYYAALYGHQAIVKLLVDSGADVDARGSSYGNALYIASAHGHYAVVNLLVSAGANVNEQVGNALQAASIGGHEAIVKLLVGAGADVNAQGGEYYNALYAASVDGHEAIVKLLIEAGADVNAQSEGCSNALNAASSGGYEAIVEVLLGAGADVNAQGRYYYGNALHAASADGYEAIVKLLLGAGADVNAQGRHYYGNALQAASVDGHEAIVKLLIEAGADVNAQSEGYGNALNAASAGGQKAIVKLLLRAGADVNTQGGEYGSALHAASVDGHEAIVNLLIEAGADVNARSGGYEE